ncbi:hypothetical protein CFE70_005418 [Pyrenophora teres f. teres 0-1]|uniref:BTB domain-containing protein n=2 Tax=Pyrenophora teres f. teres TaxID=97479 RepID=E3RCX5_PYRTT|nr:hypothetical protein PTT_01257 [Pyrenophora teres f. teres 0-1]KAE8839057.1 hypothetical protein HRS9139_03440 [Pyrenophora teres f. teres]KAE8845022.1 hypothetical protein PTNB85_03287 [Pyrenophora teres f. teres]KAE8846773.1 hypothetical protein HRS9122_03680 [Pyrenophora teres f. teres]KAE8865830.1 hypothetical protein PTNB29_02977 [Pyrenophora teres f. teres]
MATNTPKKAAIMSYSPSSFLTVRVGKKNPQEFLLHEGIICARSGFFHRAMNGNWAETDQRLVTLPEDDKKVVALYVNIIYTNNIIERSTFEQDCPTHQDQILTLTKLYIFAEKMMDKGAKNKTIETLLRVIKAHSNVKGNLPNGVAVEFMYANTLKGSCGRRLMVDLWYNSNADILADILAESEIICKDFFIDLIRASSLQRPVNQRNIALISKVDMYYEV